jgi:PAS domain S-box-containing protein
MNNPSQNARIAKRNAFSASSGSAEPTNSPDPRDALTSLVEGLADAILILDRDWRITYANREAMRVSRLSSADINSRTHWQLFPETIGTHLETAYRAAMESGRREHIEYFYEPFDLWVDIGVMPTPDGLAIHYRDITERKRAEQQRDSASQRLRQVLDVTTDAVAVLDRNWNFTYLNRTASEMLDMKGSLVGKNLYVEFPATLNSIYERSYRETMDKGIATEFESFYPDPLNAWIWVQARAYEDGIVLFFRDITERKIREKALKEQQELLEVVQHAALTATWDYDLAGGSISYGPGSFPIFGRPLEELHTPQAFKAIIYPPDLPRVRAAVAEAVQESLPVVLEFRVMAPDGSRIWIESRGRAMHREGGSTHLRGLSIDVSLRKRNEEALVASEERYRVLAHLNPQAIWMGAPDGSIIYANQGLLAYVGQTVEDMQGLGWLQAYFAGDRDRVLERWAQSVLTGVDHEVEARMIRASDRAVRWWSIRARAVRDETGAILHWLGVGTDIHESKTASEIMRRKHLESERQRAELETVYQTAPVGLALFDPVELRCLRLNERQAEILGLPIDQVVGRTLSEIAPMPGLEEMFRSAASGHPVRNQVFEGELSTRPGEHRVWNVSLMPVYGEDNSIQAVTAAWLEITHLKRAEAALVQSEKLAAVGRLASSISHEINNPLEAITNLLYLIAHHEDLPEEVKVFVHMAQSELARVSQIATQTLRFHRQAVKPTLVTPADLMDAVVNLYHGRLANSGIKVKSSYATATRILCFENDIRQVLNNLIANAIDAMRSGGHLLIRAHNAINYNTGSRGVRLTVADTGHGMSQTVQRRIFEPFFTTKDLNGTGLGLWISEGIVQRHGGRLFVRSSDRASIHGTVFTLFLPCPEEACEEEKAA